MYLKKIQIKFYHQDTGVSINYKREASIYFNTLSGTDIQYSGTHELLGTEILLYHYFFYKSYKSYTLSERTLLTDVGASIKL